MILLKKIINLQKQSIEKKNHGYDKGLDCSLKILFDRYKVNYISPICMYVYTLLNKCGKWLYMDTILSDHEHTCISHCTVILLLYI